MKKHKSFIVLGTLFVALFLTAAGVLAYTITAGVDGVGGNISPSGTLAVAPGVDQTFTFTPSTDVVDVVVDGVSLGALPSYTFPGVSADHSIFASFACQNELPVMLNGVPYGSIMDAYDDASNILGLNDFALKLMAGTFPEEVMTFNTDASVLLEGGYDCSFLGNSGMVTKIPGSLTIGAGTVIPSNIVLSSPPLCAPGDPNNFPGNTETCDGADNNCNGLVDEAVDDDLDGFTGIDPCSGIGIDCDDTNPDTYPGAPEICDGLDNNCNGLVDEDDADGDGYTAIDACLGSKNDCNDNNAGIHPGAADIFGDGIDQDCSGQDLDYLPGEPCIECHANPPSDPLIISNDHLNKVGSPDGTCRQCHPTAFPNVLSGHYGRIVKSDGNNMTAGEIIRCWSCHDYHDDPGYSDFTNIVWAKVTSAPRPLTCDVCHEDRLARHLYAHDNRVILELCSHCHTSDTTVLGMPGSGTLTSQGDVNTLHRSDCYLCHEYNGTKIDPATVSQAIIDGNTGAQIDCLTCHGAAFSTIHAFLEGHYNLVRVGDTGCGNCHVDATDATTLVNPDDPKVHNDCSSCHNADFSTRSYAAGKHFADYAPPNAPGDCTTCHLDPFATIHPDNVDHSQAIQLSAECSTCHAAPPPVVDPNDPTRHGSCDLCHDNEGTLINDAAGNAAPNECTTCHVGDLGDIHPNISTAHEATPGSENVLVFNAGEHDPSLVGDATVYMACLNCHNTTAINVLHGNNCSTCHPSPYDTLGTWSGGCQEGGCHPSKHVDSSAKHIPFYVNNECTLCHGDGINDFPPLPSSCANCHAFYDPNDTTPPVTTSDVQPTYVLPTFIHFTATDNGGKVGIYTTFYRLDGGEVQTGRRAFESAFGPHTLEFWSVDQVGNEELPHNTASFDNLIDTMPPATTSDVQPVYDHTSANITLTPTDDNAAGIIYTYFSLNGGDIQEGTSINVPQYFPNAGESGILDNTLDFWSVDWSLNEELPHHTVNFKMVGGSGTLRLIWLDSDTTGSPCPDDSLARVEWEIRKPGTNIIGSAGCPSDPNWSGVNDIVVPVSVDPYFVDIFWYESADEGLSPFPNVSVSIQGDVVELHY